MDSSSSSAFLVAAALSSSAFLTAAALFLSLPEVDVEDLLALLGAQRFRGADYLTLESAVHAGVWFGGPFFRFIFFLKSGWCKGEATRSCKL